MTFHRHILNIHLSKHISHQRCHIINHFSKTYQNFIQSAEADYSSLKKFFRFRYNRKTVLFKLRARMQ